MGPRTRAALLRRATGRVRPASLRRQWWGPEVADAQFSLAAVYARIDRVSEAMEHLDTCLGLSPDHYARICSADGCCLCSASLPSFAQSAEAVSVEPDSREAHLFLADAYAQLGRSAEKRSKSAGREGKGAGSLKRKNCVGDRRPRLSGEYVDFDFARSQPYEVKRRRQMRSFPLDSRGRLSLRESNEDASTIMAG